MPALPNAPRVLRITFQGTYTGAVWNNVFHVQGTNGPASQADANTVAQQLQNAWTTRFAALSVAGVTLNTVLAQDLTSNLGVIGSAPSGSTGTHTGTAPLSANVAACISWKIARHYRGGHPRTYITGIDQSELSTTDRRMWGATFQNLVASQAAGFLTTVNSGSTPTTGQLTLGSLSYWSGHALRASPVFDPFTTGTCDARVDTQRRRLGKDVPG